ncbi:hypothetical protein [Streptomyces sp. NPDC006193]|uniref:hypothetical protein n=1 Tax=Streptomyces sp. NPDC006193 TaxID=3155717 RepID=UPI0033BF1341
MSTPPQQRRILIVGPSARLARTAAAAGFRVWSLSDARRCPPGEVAALSERFLRADFDDEGALKDALAEAADAGLHVNPPLAVRLLARPEALRRFVRDNRLSPPAAEDAAGERYRVDTLSVHGMHHTVGITAETPYGLLHPAPLAGDTAATVRSVVTSLLDLAGYQYGPAHTVVLLTPHGPAIAGCEAVVAEEPVPALVRVAAGRDMVADAVRVLAGRDVGAVQARRFAASVALPGDGRAGALPLPCLHPVRESGGRRAGHAVLAADSPQQAAERARDANRLLA